MSAGEPGEGTGAVKTIIHVNRHIIAANRKTGRRDPIFTVKTYKGTQCTNVVSISGEAKFVYRPEKPLSCGAVAWVEADSADVVVGRNRE